MQNNWKWDNSFTQKLLGEPEGPIFSRQTPQVNFAYVKPTPVKKPELLIWSPDAAALLDLASAPDPEVFSGNSLIPGMQPFAARYGGHQFGNWAGQLGDGRAITLGEIINQRNERWEIQLKGAGPTPYSRRADGRAVLRSSLREYICSEAMHHLGIPTTRALCCVTTGDLVERDMFYDGHPAYEAGAITTRLSPTFVRFGNFEILASQREFELLRRLADYTINTHFPDISQLSDPQDRISAFFRRVADTTFEMILHWMRVGFVHGVMNTDNMSVLGLTIDYGPYGFLDDYDPDWTPNTTDFSHRRYRYAQQPGIGLWNLARFAESLAPLLDNHEELENTLKNYQEQFTPRYLGMLGQKIGIDFEAGDADLLVALDSALRSTETDMTMFFRRLADLVMEKPQDRISFLSDIFYTANPDSKALAGWLDLYAERIRSLAPDQVKTRMNRVNPYFIPRNYILQECIDELAQSKRDRLDAVQAALRNPYVEDERTRPFFQKRPEWARNRPGCSALSCSS